MHCPHYQTKLDIVSIRFKCCGRFYPCYRCHEERETHPLERWQAWEFGSRAILCRNCEEELSILDYVSCNSRCIYCDAAFNPRCQSHWDLYFETSGLPSQCDLLRERASSLPHLAASSPTPAAHEHLAQNCQTNS